jgi:hypothetical protein
VHHAAGRAASATATASKDGIGPTPAAPDRVANQRGGHPHHIIQGALDFQFAPHSGVGQFSYAT